jgi:glycosyltransferase involved in cell wall biosynthesis
MTIGLITDSIRNDSTGIGYYTKTVIESLIKNKKKNEYVYIDFQETKFNKGELLKVNNPFKFLKTYLWHNYLPYKLRESTLDVVYNFSGTPHLFPYKQNEVFFVYDISWFLYPRFHKFGRVLFYKLLFKRNLQFAKLLVTDSNHAKNELIKNFNIKENKIVVSYPGLNYIKNIKKPNLVLSFPYLLFVGTIEPRKNIESLIKVFISLKKQKKIPHKLIICGKKGWKFKRIFEMVKNSEIQKEVIFTGYVTDEEKKYLYKNADIFIYPTFYEGFGIPVLEAMTYGCPVITSNTSSLPEVVGKAGITIKPDSLPDLTAAIIRVFNDNKLKRKMILEGYKQAKKFTSRGRINYSI